MSRITVAIPAHIRARLRDLASQRGVPLATIIREAIEEKLAAQRPRPESLGVGWSGERDVARRSGEERPEPRSWR